MDYENKLLNEFMTALEEEIEAIKAGKGGSTTKVFDGKLLREADGMYIYSFSLDNFIATIDDAPIEIDIAGKRMRGYVVSCIGLDITVAIEQDAGKYVSEALITTNLWFLYDLLKKKFKAVLSGEISPDFSLSNKIFTNFKARFKQAGELPELLPHPPLDKHKREAIKKSQMLLVSIIWGPPGTGKTTALAGIVESFIKRSMKVLVVCHANVAVDEAIEDIAERLEETPYYQNGEIIRFGILQKKDIGDNYPLVLLDNIAERASITLRQMKNDLEAEKKSMKGKRELVKKAISAEKELNAAKKSEEYYKTQIDECNHTISALQQQIGNQHKTLQDTQSRLSKAKRLGTIQRLLTGLSPRKIELAIKDAKDAIHSLEIELDHQGNRLRDIQNNHEQSHQYVLKFQSYLHDLLIKLKAHKGQLAELNRMLNMRGDQISNEIRRIGKELSKVKQEILTNANVIATTLTKTFCTKDFPNISFDVLIVDEASMAPLPHLFWAASKCKSNAVIIGDFLQLPPICISEKDMACKWLGRSIYQILFIENVKRARSDARVAFLPTQYRMHPDISAIPNDLFYDTILQDASETSEYKAKDKISYGHLCIIDTSGASPWCQRLEVGSRINIYHALLSVELAKRVLSNYGGVNNTKIGIITPYAPQARLIKRMSEDAEIKEDVRVSTVHRFQGGQEETIIFDTVEGLGTRVAPMLDDQKEDSEARLLLNVAMTRAKAKIFLIANLRHLSKELSSDSILRRIVAKFERTGEIVDSRHFVNEYFATDFEKWVGKLISPVRQEEWLPQEASLYTEKNFYRQFFLDLKDAKDEIIIASPFVYKRSVSSFMDLFRVLKNRGVNIRIYTRPAQLQMPETGSSQSPEDVITHLQSLGVKVFERKRMHQKIGIIDRKILWEGSLNILSHKDTQEHMRRITYEKGINEIIRMCELGDVEINSVIDHTKPILTMEKCPICGAPMEVRKGKYGGFLSCSEFAKTKCDGKRNIKKWDKIETPIRCPKCQNPMILRVSSKGPFLGCSRYPKCKKTLNI